MEENKQVDYLNSISQAEFEKILKTALDSKYFCIDVKDTKQKKSNDQSPEHNRKSRPAAVLILFAFSSEPKKFGSDSDGPYLLFIRRTETVATHKGQMAFPGGLCEAIDRDNPISTALRETQEEVGISPEQIRVLGKIHSINTITGYTIQPIIGVLLNKMDDVVLQLDPNEIAEAVWIPLQKLMCTETYRHEVISDGTFSYPIHVYQVNQYRIWGATASMTKNLLDRLNKLEES